MVIRKRNNACGLYKLEITKPAPMQSTTNMFQEYGSDVTNRALAWHKGLGHFNFQSLFSLLRGKVTSMTKIPIEN